MSIVSTFVATGMPAGLGGRAKKASFHTQRATIPDPWILNLTRKSLQTKPLGESFSMPGGRVGNLHIKGFFSKQKQYHNKKQLV